jgi:hypothetical protein
VAPYNRTLSVRHGDARLYIIPAHLPVRVDATTLRPQLVAKRQSAVRRQPARGAHPPPTFCGARSSSDSGDAADAAPRAARVARRLHGQARQGRAEDASVRGGGRVGSTPWAPWTGCSGRRRRPPVRRACVGRARERQSVRRKPYERRGPGLRHSQWRSRHAHGPGCLRVELRMTVFARSCAPCVARVQPCPSRAEVEARPSLHAPGVRLPR